MNNQVNKKEEYFRFKVFQGAKDLQGKLQNVKSVGMAYLKSGQNIFTLRLWTFSWERYYLLPHRSEPSKYLVMTREPNKSPQAKNKYFWNIVGSGRVDSIQGYVELEFDLLDKPIFVNIHPEPSPESVNLPEPDFIRDAA